MFSGLFTAIITPFDKNENFDEKSFEKIIQNQIAAGVDGIVVAGTTGESPTISAAEREKMIRLAKNRAGKNQKIIAGTGGNDTKKVVEKTRAAQKAGADAALVVAPFYNKPTPAGLFLHFEKIAKSTPDFPILLYDVPGRTGVKIAAETTIALSKIPNIVGIKIATGNLDDTKNLVGKVPADFSILSGDDDLTVKIIKNGGHGVISVASNLKPVEMKKMIDAAISGNFKIADAENEKMKSFFAACFWESNPIPIKFLMTEKGFCQKVFRLPMCPPTPETAEKLKTFL